MDLKQIKDLIAAMEKAGVKKLSLKEKTGYELHLEMQDEFSSPPPSISHHPQHTLFIPHPASRSQDVSHQILASPIEENKQKPPEKVDGKYVTSPMVGTFYAAPSPEDPPFVKIGDRVEAGTLICIVEAMKVMNEVKAGMSGVVAEVCLESGHPVEFGTKLFRIV